MQTLLTWIKETFKRAKDWLADFFNFENPLNKLKNEIIKPFQRLREKKDYLTELRSSETSFRKKITETLTHTNDKLSTIEQDAVTHLTKQEIAHVRTQIQPTQNTTKLNNWWTAIDEITGISINAFKQAIGKVETNTTYDIVNNWGKSTAVGKYQFLWWTHGKTIKKFMHEKNIQPKPFKKKIYQEICKKYNNNTLLTKHTKDHQFIYHFLTEPQLQENFMTYFIQAHHKTDIEKIYTSYNTTYGEPIVWHGWATYTLAELYMLVHFQWRRWAMTVLKKWASTLPGSVTQQNSSIASYKQAFQDEYSDYV